MAWIRPKLVPSSQKAKQMALPKPRDAPVTSNNNESCCDDMTMVMMAVSLRSLLFLAFAGTKIFLDPKMQVLVRGHPHLFLC
jgi:hypothetical protein